MGVSINEGSQSGWFIVGNPSINGWFLGTPILGNPHMWCLWFLNILHTSELSFSSSDLPWLAMNGKRSCLKPPSIEFQPPFAIFQLWFARTDPHDIDTNDKWTFNESLELIGIDWTCAFHNHWTDLNTGISIAIALPPTLPDRGGGRLLS